MQKYLFRIIMAIALVLIGIGFIIVMQSSSMDIYVSLHNSATNTGKSNYEYTSVVSKQWFESDGTTGAEYDFYVYNNSLSDLTNWSVTITVPDNCRIDSHWPGKAVISDEKLIYTPNFSDEKMMSGNYTKFGFILYSSDLIDTDSAVLTAHATYNYKIAPAYKLLCASIFAWVVIAIVYSAALFKIRSINKQQQHDREIIEQSIKTFVNFIDAKDPYTRGHSSRVAIYAREIARRMKFSSNDCQTIYYMALMHDAGKIAIPDSILNKSGALNDDEKEIIKSHTLKGGEMLDAFSSIPNINEGALYHHERYDGKGYPMGISGKDIPLYARIICIADSYDTMSTNRCYRSHLDEESILKELAINTGSQFDPDIVEYMVDMIRDGFVYTVNNYKEDYEIEKA